MDYSFNDINMSDPFQTLDMNLDDVAAVIQVETSTDYPMDTQFHMQQPSSSTAYPSTFSRPNQHSPPQEYYDPKKSREIGSIVSLLQNDSPPRMDPYSSMKFSPPVFESSLGSTARMLSTISDCNYDPNSLAYKLTAPGLQPLPPVQSPPAMYVDTQMSPSYSMKEEKLRPYGRPNNVKMEPPFLPADTSANSFSASKPTSPTSPSPRKTSGSTKEELLRLLVNMSPSDVERLKDRGPRPSAVATRVQKEQKWAADDDMSDGDDDDQDSQQSSQPIRRYPKTERRTAHNLIEKKYRCSINDRIQYLKTILGGDDAKLSKSATLRRAIEHINNLESENQMLRQEVERLQMLMRNNKMEVSSVLQMSSTPNMSSMMTSQLPSPLLSPSSSSSMQSPESMCSTTSPPPSKERRKGGMDQVRLSMFAMMFALLIWNPISFLAGEVSAHDTSAPNVKMHIGRVLDTNDDVFDGYNSSDDWWHSNVIRPGFVWSVNIFVVVCVLIRLLVYGEPVQDFKSRSWSQFLSIRQRAREEADAGNVKEAMRQYMECLQILERPLPSAGLDCFLSVVWQIVRHTLNWLWIGRWFARRRRSAVKPVTVVCKSHAHTAVIYHKLHQLHLMGVDETEEECSGLYLALSAVNLAESAGASVDGLPRSVMADIYLAAAIRTRMCLYAPFAKIVSMYFYRRSRRHIRRVADSSVNGLQWMFHPLSKKFLSDPINLNNILTKRESAVPFSSEAADTPVVLLRKAFKLHLLKLLTEQLAGSLEQKIDVVDVSRLLISISTSGGMPKKEHDWNCDTSLIEGDPMCTWWTHVLTCALFWKHDKKDLAKKSYTVVRQCPQELLSVPLALAVGHAFCARKICIDDRNNAKFGNFVYMHSRKALEIMRSVHRKENEEIQSLQESLSTLAYEWLMTSLLDAWRVGLEPGPYWTQKSKIDYRTLYQEASNHYAHINEKSGTTGAFRILVYSLTCRMLNGANPVQTWTSVARIMKQMMTAASGNGGNIDRSNQPDPFHLHVLTRLHSSISKTHEK